MKLRPYQEEAVESVLDAFKKHAAALVVMPTGTGKTVMFSHVAKRMHMAGRTMVLAHRAELIHQAANKLWAVTGDRPEIEMAEHRADTSSWFNGGNVVSSIQTQIAGEKGKGRMTRFRPSEFGLVVVDEAHHATASTYRRVLDHYRCNEALRVLGVTATPDRADEQALGQVFETVAYVYEIQDAIGDGWLVPIRQQYVEVEGLDFSKCRTTAGDLNGRDLAEVMEYERNLHEVATPLVELTSGRKTLVFAVSVAHAERLCEILVRHGRRAAWLCGKTPKDERSRILERFAAGDTQFVVNVGVLTEGFDDPSIEVVAIARPTKSRSLYSQMVGRGTRPLNGLVDPVPDADGRRGAIEASGKPAVEVIDFVGNSGRHKLITTADILGGKLDEEVVERAVKNAQAAGVSVDVAAEIERAEREILEAKRRKQERDRRRLTAKSTYSTKNVDPFDVLSLTPQRDHGWERHSPPATDKQISMLSRMGVDHASSLTLAQASQLVSSMRNRAAAGKCTYKQAKLLKKWGMSADISKAEASTIISAKNASQRKPFVPRRAVG